jgi:hypothetical protein
MEGQVINIIGKISNWWYRMKPATGGGQAHKQDTILKTRHGELDLTLLLAARSGGRQTMRKL